MFAVANYNYIKKKESSINHCIVRYLRRERDFFHDNFVVSEKRGKMFFLA